MLTHFDIELNRFLLQIRTQNKRKGWRKMKQMMILLSLLAIAGFMGCGTAGNPEAESAAVDAAKSWLALVDDQQYAESWDETAGVFKGAVSRERWIEMAGGVRRPFGENVSRQLKSKRYRTTLPGAPDGEYVVIQFKSSFEKKKTAVETITPMLDEDGTWRVSGYYMK